MKISTPCKCKRATLFQTGPRSLSRCPHCGVKYGFTINLDNTVHLFHNGRMPMDSDRRKRPFSVSWSTDQDTRTQAKGWTRQRLLDYAYRTIILATNPPKYPAGYLGGCQCTH